MQKKSGLGVGLVGPTQLDHSIRMLVCMRTMSEAVWLDWAAASISSLEVWGQDRTD